MDGGEPRQPYYVIIGAGAIGGYVGILLHCAGIKVRFLLRDSASSKAQQEILQETGLTALCSTDAKFKKVIKPNEIAEIFTRDDSCLQDCTCILVGTKRTQNIAVHKQLLDAHVKCPVAFLQNGLLITETLEPKAYEQIECVVDFNTVYDMKAGTITLSQSMEESALILDARQSSAAALSPELARMPIKIILEKEFPAAQRGKLLMNLTNAVNALSGKNLLPMFMEAEYRQVLAYSIEEAKAVFVASGLPPKAPKPSDAMALRLFVCLLRSPDCIFNATVGKKLRGRGDGNTSMAQDLAAHRVPTEIDFLNGEIVRLGQKHKVPTPVNEKLIDLIKMAEEDNAGSPRISSDVLMSRTGVTARRCCL